MSTIYHTDERGRLEVDYHHNYSNHCRCMSCLEMFLAISEGVVVVRSFDNQHQMELPKKTATIFTRYSKPKEEVRIIVTV